MVGGGRRCGRDLVTSLAAGLEKKCNVGKDSAAPAHARVQYTRRQALSLSAKPWLRTSKSGLARGDSRTRFALFFICG